VFEGKSERKLHICALRIGKIKLINLPSVTRLFIPEPIPTLIPASTALKRPTREKTRLHALKKIKKLTRKTYIFEQALAFGKIPNNQLHTACKVGRIAHAEGKPLEVAGGVGIASHEQVIFFVTDSSYLVDISTLKIGVELNQT